MNSPRLKMNRPELPSDKDRIVQQTDVDALQSRRSAVDTGYLKDPFAGYFLEGGSGSGGPGGPNKPRRYPLINRGTYVRTTAIDMLVEKFLRGCEASGSEKVKKRQIISLGAGSDTRFFRIASSFLASSSSISSFSSAPSTPTATSTAAIATPPPTLPYLYHEFDFPAVTSRKIAAITRHAALSSILSNPSVSQTSFAVGSGGSSLSSESYYIHPVDLRTLKPGAAPLTGIDTSLPTLVISECCLIYLSPQEADDIIRWISSLFAGGESGSSTPVGVIIYEPIGGDDPFGRVMVQNLAARGIVLRTLKKYSSLTRQRERLRVLLAGAKADTTGACDVNFIHDRWIDAGERERMDGLEMLDEREEWVLLAKHYCVAWGWRDGDGEDAATTAFEAWKELLLQDSAD